MARYPSTVMVSIVCPWDDDERLDEAIFRRATRHALASGFRHLYVFGTAGEGYAVDTASVPAGRRGAPGRDVRAPLTRSRWSGSSGCRRPTSWSAWASRTNSGSGRSRSRCRAGRRWPTPRSSTYFESVCGAFPDSAFMHYNTVKSGRLVNWRPLPPGRRPGAQPGGHQDHDQRPGRRRRRRPRGAGADAFPDRAVDRVRRRCSGRWRCSGRSRPWRRSSRGPSSTRSRTAGPRRPRRSGRGSSALNHTVFDPLMVDRRVDGAYDKTIEKLSNGMAAFPLRMLSPYRTVSDLEFEATRSRLADAFPELV